MSRKNLGPSLFGDQEPVENIVNLSKSRKVDNPPPVPQLPAVSAPEGMSWTEFMQKHGRIPMIQDTPKPWTYRGWLWWYLTECERLRVAEPRWNYWIDTQMAGKILDDPIPTIDFTHYPFESSDGYKMIDKCVRIVDASEGGWSSVGKFIEWLHYGLGMGKKVPQFHSERTPEQLYREFSLEPFVKKPADYLGEWIANQRSNWNPNAFFPTPHNVCEMMIRMTMGDPGEKDMKCETLMEPAVGTGRFLMHASNYSLRLYGQEVDYTIHMACVVNMALYVPWACRPFPEAWFDEYKQRRAKALDRDKAVRVDEPVAPARPSKRKRRRDKPGNPNVGTPDRPQPGEATV